MKLSLFHMSLPKMGEELSGDAVIVRIEANISLLCVIDALGHGPIAAAVADKARDFLATAPLTKGALDITEGLHGALRGTRGAAGMCCILRGDRIEGCGVGNVELRVVAHRNTMEALIAQTPPAPPVSTEPSEQETTRATGVRRTTGAITNSRDNAFASRSEGIRRFRSESADTSFQGIRGASQVPGSAESTPRTPSGRRGHGGKIPVVLTPGILGVQLQRARVFEGALTPGVRLLFFSDGVSPRMEHDKFEQLSAENACKSMMHRYRRSQDDATLLIADVQAHDG